MGIYLPNMEMPKDKPLTLVIYPDRTVANVYEDQRGTAVPVPPHGDLIDRDVLIQSKEIDSFGAVFAVAKAPTVIPADMEADP